MAGDTGGITDLHSHLVPGVDDGAQSIEDTLASVERMTGVGVRRIITTPHIAASLTRIPSELSVRLEEVTRVWEGAQRAVGEAFPEVEFLRGHEVMLDHPDPDLSDERLHLAGTPFVLVEWPRMQIPPQTGGAVARLVAGGVIPVIAHPERYVGMMQQLHLAGGWRQGGAVLQVNHASLAGRYGKEAQSVAFKILRRGWADVLSTDFHGRDHLKLYIKEAQATFEALGADEQFHLLTVVNPGRIADGLRPQPVPAIISSPSAGVWRRVRGFFSQSES